MDCDLNLKASRLILQVFLENNNNHPEIDGKPLKGKQILEIPEINKNFSEIEQYVELAKNKYNIEIRFRSE